MNITFDRAFAALLGFMFFFIAFSASAQDGSSDVTFRSVPNVVGATEREASETLRNSGLRLFVRDQRLLSIEDIGTIARQSPRGGDRVAVGTEIEVFISSGTLMPDLRGFDERQARAQLSHIPFHRVRFDTVSSLLPAGSVVSHLPEAGDRFSPSTTRASVTLSTGTIPVPEGLTASSSRDFSPTIERVRDRLAQFGFAGRITVTGCSRSRPGDVSLCDPAHQHCVVIGIDPPPPTEVSADQQFRLTTEIRTEGIAHLFGDEPCVPRR